MSNLEEGLMSQQ